MKTACGLFLLCLFGWPFSIPFNSLHSEDTASSGEYQTVDHNGIRVTFLEMAKSQTPNGKHVFTSFLFMVEDTAKEPRDLSHSSPIRIFDEKNKRLFEDATNGSPQTGTIISNYEPNKLGSLPAFPNPDHPRRTTIVRHWISSIVPDNITAVETEFGSNGKNKTYRFKLKQLDGK